MNSPMNTAPKPSDIFRTKYLANDWGPAWNSGTGSDPDREGSQYVHTITAIINKQRIRNVVDLGCGDGRILAAIASRCPDTRFTGYDCCQELIDRLKILLPRHQWEQNELDIPEDFQRLAYGELFLMKDVLHHLPSERITKTLSLLRHHARGRFLLMTQDRKQQHPDDDCEIGGYRALSGKLYPLAQFRPHLILEYLHKAIWQIDLGP